MSDGKNLHKAKEAKQDEFYTQLEDIENELRHYKGHFKGKTVLCNCDDPYESNFFKYFAMNFNHLGLKKLITTCYVTSPVMYTQLSIFDDMEYSIEAPTNPKKKPYKVEITEINDENGDGAFDLDDIKQLLKNKKNVCSVLKGNGDFRSEECVELLKESDIVVTNPPFSLFRDFVAILVENNKKFVIIGPKGAIGYKEIFPLIKNNQMWVGMMPMSREMYFDVPKVHADYLLEQKRDRSIVQHNGRMMARAGAVWYTNLDIDKRHEEMILYKHYSPEIYPTYYNFDAIDVDSTEDIPCDYWGNMGVPITFLDKYNPEQFSIIGLGRDGEGITVDRSIYPKIKELNPNSRPSHIGFFQKNGIPKEPFSRVIIRRKEQPQ